MRWFLVFLCLHGVTLRAQIWIGAEMPFFCTGVVTQLYDDTSDDRLLACGAITASDNFAACSIIRYDGNAWDTLGVFGNIIRTVVRYGDTLLAGGGFSTVHGQPMRALAAYYDQAWHPYGDFPIGYAAEVRKLRVINGSLYAVGSFAILDGHTCNGVARREGGQWVNIGLIDYSEGLEPIVIDIAEYQGDIIVGGEMSPLNMDGHDILRYDGQEWSVLGGGILGGFSAVGALEVYQSELYVGGDIYEDAGNAGHGLMRWNGSEWNDVGGSMRDIYGGTENNASVLSLLQHDDKLYVGGGFGYAGDIPANQFAIWDGTGWCANGDSLGNATRAMAFYHDTLFVNCRNELNSGPANYVARWTGGSLEQVCEPGVGIGDPRGPTSLNCFPNPATDWIIIRSGDQTTTHAPAIAEVRDVTGRMVINGPLTKGAISMDIGALNSGTYYIVLLDQAGKFLGACRCVKR